MDLTTAEFLCSTIGGELLASATESKLNDFALAKLLRNKTTPEFAAAICTTLELRRKAIKKFSKAARMLFIRSALEQASAEEIAKYRTIRLIKHNFKNIIDLGCAIGGDSIAFSSKLQTTGVELDSTRLRLAEYNISIYNHTSNFTPIQADITTLQPQKIDAEVFFIDPARRSNTGKRLFSPESWSPKLSEVHRWLTSIPNGIVKAAPGIDHADIPQGAEAEFISFNGELRECILWFGKLNSGRKIQATLLPAGVSLSGENPVVKVTTINKYLYEPDSAVIRAGLVQLLASKIGATKISSPIALLTGEKATETPFARCFKIIKSLKFNEKELKKELQRLDCGSLNITKRGSPIDVPKLLKKLKLKGKQHLNLFLTRNFEERIAIITEPTPVN